MLLGLLRIPRRIRFLLVKFAKYLHSAAWTLIRHVPYLVISLNSHLQSVIICRRRRLVPSNSTVQVQVPARCAASEQCVCCGEVGACS